MNISSLSFKLLNRQIWSFKSSSVLQHLGVRCLYSPSALGLDGYVQVRERIRTQFNEMADRFRSKMKEFVGPNSVNMVFTEDLKHMVHLADGTEDDMQLVEEMMTKFNKQNKDLRFGSFVFGPVVMRMYYHLNKPKEALQAFTNPDLENFFDQIISYQILMDLLFNNEMYDEVIQVMDIVQDKQIAGSRFPRNVVVLAMAAAYKKNSPESLEYMKQLWAALQEVGHEPMRRALTFASALAINQNAAHIALELLSQVPKQNYVTIRNLKLSALTDINRLDDALPILRSVLEIEGPQENKHTFCTEVVNKVKEAVSKSKNKEIEQEFKRILEQLTQLGLITNDTLDSHLCSEIEKVILAPRQSRDQRVVMAKFENARHRRREGGLGEFHQSRRPGLSNLE